MMPAQDSKPETTFDSVPSYGNPLADQIGGSHYKNFAIQPVEFIHANRLDFIRGNIVKYIARDKNKGHDEDIKKAIHYAKLLLKLEYNYTDDQISML